jgi:hypothetical protein
MRMGELVVDGRAEGRKLEGRKEGRKERRAGRWIPRKVLPLISLSPFANRQSRMC